MITPPPPVLFQTTSIQHGKTYVHRLDAVLDNSSAVWRKRLVVILETLHDTEEYARLLEFSQRFAYTDLTMLALYGHSSIADVGLEHDNCLRSFLLREVRGDTTIIAAWGPKPANPTREAFVLGVLDEVVDVRTMELSLPLAPKEWGDHDSLVFHSWTRQDRRDHAER